LSTSERTDFDDWLAAMLKQHGEFTVLVILAAIGDRSVTPLCSSYMHVVGGEIDWDDIKNVFASSGRNWDAAAFFPTKGPHGGPIDNPTARQRLAELEARVAENRMFLNEGHFFDSCGRRIEVERLEDA
jgi:hypothetical protein